jgi:hypothetical protein
MKTFKKLMVCSALTALSINAALAYNPLKIINNTKTATSPGFISTVKVGPMCSTAVLSAAGQTLPTKGNNTKTFTASEIQGLCMFSPSQPCAATLYLTPYTAGTTAKCDDQYKAGTATLDQTNGATIITNVGTHRTTASKWTVTITS